jgi:energy-coupling factor transporter ATP-binding protein EcfA2
VALAACLVQAPDVLLLDEPEAHLDVARRRIVEELVQDFDGAVLIVSHDRHLLDETVGQIAELEHGRIRMWQGGYSAYAVAREVELVRRQQQYVTQQKEIARMEEAIRRFKDWAHRVVDERHIKRARNMQRRIDRMDKVERPVFERRKMALALRSQARGGDRVIALREVAFAPCSAASSSRSCAASASASSARSAPARPCSRGLLAGDLQPTAGERWAGPSISVEYVSQAATELPGDRTPIDVVRAAQPLSEGEAVSLLVRFLFDYEQLRRPISSMSGGERTRLRCCLVMLSAANCLILDEPTNHLDIPAVETLEAALESYDGTVIAVSHDRYFLERIADRVLEVGDGRVQGRGAERVGVGRLPALEGQDPRVLDTPSRISMRAADRLVGVPRLRAGHDDRQVGQQRRAVLPRRRVPQVRRAVVDGVVAQSLPDREHRLGERGRPRPLEGHPLVAGDVDEQRPGRKRPRSSFMTNMSGASVSCRMQLTTMSCSASTSTSGVTSRRPWASVRPGRSGRGRTGASAPRRSARRRRPRGAG